MVKIQITKLLVCSWLALSISLAQQTSNGSSTRSNGLGSHTTVAQLRSGYLRRDPASSAIRTHPTDNQSATAELNEQKQPQGNSSPGETPQVQTVAGLGPQERQQFPGYARPGPPYFGFNFGAPPGYPQAAQAAGQSASPQSSQQIQPRATPFYPSGFGGFNFQTSADLFNRFNPSSQAGNAGQSNPGSSSETSETGPSSGNGTPSVQAQNFGTSFSGGFPFPSGFNQNFPQNPFSSTGFGTTGQGAPIPSSPDDGSQKSTVGFYGSGAPNIGSYSFPGNPQQEQQFQTQFQNSFQPPGFGQDAGLSQFPSATGFDSFGQFGFGPSSGPTGAELGNGVQSAQQSQQLFGQR